ncbi:MAG: SGNH/GDSL hydrolase family protein [Labilithrix sp.]|nr:SGNH/GDSL hydrolase family protein [Labilithrix sp.]
MRAIWGVVTWLCASACSRHHAAEGATTAPAPVPVGTATIMLATAIEEADAGADKAPSPPPLAGKTVLHVGDSMVGGQWGLTRALEQKFAAEGAKLVRDSKVSESIISYDKSSKLKELLAKHHPDIVIVTLGTNDVFVPYPASMAANVQSIVKRIGNRECWWMGPPTWKPDTGIVQVLRDNVAPCKFFDSSSLKLQRAGDGIHPTDRGGADWANSFWAVFRAAPAADAGAP